MRRVNSRSNADSKRVQVWGRFYPSERPDTGSVAETAFFPWTITEAAHILYVLLAWLDIVCQAHATYSFRGGFRAGFSGRFTHGICSRMNRDRKHDNKRNRFFALGLGVPIIPQQGLKFTLLNSDTHVQSGLNTPAFCRAGRSTVVAASPA